MKNKILIVCIAFVVSAGVLSCTLNSSYNKAKEEAERRNSEVLEKRLEAFLNGPPPNWSKEVLLGLFANGNELSIRVRTGGCTKKEDFWIWCHFDEKSKGSPPHYILTIYRKRKDECKAFHPSGLLIKYNLREELGLPNVFTYSLTNSVGVSVMSGK